MKILTFFFLIWELPQNILGGIIFVVLLLSNKASSIHTDNNRVFIETKWLSVSLGHFIYYGSQRMEDIKRIKDHEFGHAIQSMILGPLYLLIIAVPSICRAFYSLIYYKIHNEPWIKYFDGYPENWADKLREKYRWCS